MGGRGSGSGLTSSTAVLKNRTPVLQQPPAPPQSPLQPSSDLQDSAQASATLAQIASMTDSELAQAVIDSRNADMPNFLNDVSDATQKFVYQVGLNGAPTVMDQTQFDAFMKQNGIPKAEILSRGVSGNGPYTAQQVANIFKYSELNYIGGKYGGMASGAGTYFDMNGGGSTGYGGGALLTAVLNPATARVIDFYALQSKAVSFASSHPAFAKAVGGPPRGGQGGNISVWALAMGYNVISGGPVSSSYRNIIDRSAVICVK